MATEDDPLTRVEAAEYLGLSVHTLKQWAKSSLAEAYVNKVLPFKSIGRRVYYRKSDLDAYLLAKQQKNED